MAAFSLDVVRELFGHMEWADAAVWRAVLAHDAAGQDALVRGWLVHIHMVQRAFLNVWRKEPVVFREPSEFPDLASIQQWGHSYYNEARQFLEAVDAATLGRPLAMPWVREFEQHTGRSFATPTLAETMFQVTSHSTHHRGQVNARLRVLGGEPPLVDYIAWVWFGKPAADWAAAVIESRE